MRIEEETVSRENGRASSRAEKRATRSDRREWPERRSRFDSTPRDINQKVPLLRAFCSAMMQDDCSEKHPSWTVPKCF